MTEQQRKVVEPGVVAGRYRILGEIGRGGMGVVWRAEDLVIGRQVAIKELRLPAGVPPAERAVFEERVLREARTAGRLNDPAVVTVHDVVCQGSTNYIVMELVDAPTLSDVVHTHGPLPQPQVGAIGGQVLDALEAAHAAGVVHRDVKPSNIMLAAGGRVKLTDFGIAQAADDPQLTTSGTLIGSPGFLSPERVRGGEATPAADLWALGATLFFAVEGVSPFERNSTAATLHAIMNEPPYLTRCRGSLASVITGLLINEPTFRLTAPQVRALLAQAAEVDRTHPMTRQRLPAGHRPPTTTASASRRRRGLLTTVALVLAVLLAAGGAALDHWWLTSAGTVAAMDRARTYGDGGTLPEFTLSYGYCANGTLSQGRRFPSSGSVTCKEPHDIEVFSGNDSFSGDKITYPGQQSLTRFAEGWCSLVFESDVITPADKRTTLRWAALVPTERAWKPKTEDRNGLRKVFCVLWRTDAGQLTSPMTKQSS